MSKIVLLKSVIHRVEIDGAQYICTLDFVAVNHFQCVSKKGFLKVFEEIKSDYEKGFLPIGLIDVLGSMIRKEGSINPVGRKFMDQFNPFEVLATFQPIIMDLLSENLPEAKGDSEKK